MACVAALSLMRTLELEFLQPHHPRPILQLLIPSNKHLIQSIHQNLACLMKLLDDNNKNNNNRSMDGTGVEAIIKGLETELRDVAFRVEDEIEFQIAHLYDTEEEKSSSSSKLPRILQQAMQEIDAIKKELVKIMEENKLLLQGRKTTTTALQLDVVPRSDDNKMVGKDEEFEIIKKMLLNHPSKNREVVVIKGMGGTGKTTLATRVYKDQLIASHFYKRAWCVASQSPDRRQMLVALLNSMGNATSSTGDEADLALELKKCLTDQRYLVVIDDVWSITAWEDVKGCFPDDENGSRVLLTTRVEEVASSTRTNEEFYHKMSFLNQNEVLPGSEAAHSSQPTSDSDNKMVGKDEEFEIVKDMLTQRSPKKQEVVLIKGMGGIGKTTLARRVYKDQFIVSHFYKRAWCVASQHPNKRQMLVALLNSMGYAATSTDDMAGLALELKKCLTNQRYLVVIDDVWSITAWEVVKGCFPDDNCGSRVLLTTRLEEVASSTCSNVKEFYHKMSFLNQNESWNLFCKKACKASDNEFKVIGKQIVEKCSGLPLAIIMVAGLLSKLDTVDQWKGIAESLNSSSFATNIDEECSRILSFSYNHLPLTFKACFLYLGVFPEDYEINTNDIAKLWAAEGLIKPSENESFDVLINKHIQELLDRSLILESTRSCCGNKVKAFIMHDLLHAFCLQEAQKEKLLYIVRGGHESSNSSPPPPSPQEGLRWVSIQSEDPNTQLATHPSLKNCRSIFYFPFYPPETTTLLNLKLFKLLRVLHFISGSSSLCREIVDHLVHLRYLPPALGQFKVSKLSRAWNLQTLYIRADNGEGSYLEFPQLRYFNCFSICGHPPKFVHQNLQNIRWLKPHHCTKQFFGNVPNLKKVRISGDRSECNDCIENLARHLEQLERLNINASEEHYMGVDKPIPINEGFALLSNLEKLTLRNTNFEWKGINIISRLPKLNVLKLYFFACVGEKWELLVEEEGEEEETVFGQLTYLEINSIDLKEWSASNDNFPKLELLLLYECNNLEEIPPEFAEIQTLKLIELKGCHPSAVASAKQIETDKREFGNDSMIVIEEDTIPGDVVGYDEDDFDELESDED